MNFYGCVIVWCGIIYMGFFIIYIFSGIKGMFKCKGVMVW